jgi:hypothetical protein
MSFGGGKPSTTHRSDADILDLIEDFLVNHFGEDDRVGLRDGAAIAILEHIESLVELRLSRCPGNRECRP